jgi:YbbR domain-containing protein
LGLPDLIRRSFLENAGLKGLAFVLAVTIFILVRSEKETERTVKVGVAYAQLEGRELVSEVPDNIDVWVRGPWTRIKRLDPAQIPPIAIDLNKVTDGEFSVEESAIHLPVVGLHVVTIKPAHFNVRFKHEKKVSVVPEPAGAPPDGYAVERISLNPTSVMVHGSKAAIDQITDVRTQPLSMVGKRASFTQRVELAELPNGVTADVSAVDVEVQVIEEAANRTLASVPVYVQPPQTALRQSPALISGLEIDPPQVEIVLRGGQAAMKAVENGRVTAMVELRLEDYTPGRTRSALVQVEGLPAGVAPEVHPREVTVGMKVPPK